METRLVIEQLRQKANVRITELHGQLTICNQSRLPWGSNYREHWAVGMSETAVYSLNQANGGDLFQTYDMPAFVALFLLSATQNYRSTIQQSLCAIQMFLDSITAIENSPDSTDPIRGVLLIHAIDGLTRLLDAPNVYISPATWDFVVQEEFRGHYRSAVDTGASDEPEQLPAE